jgi:fumarate reductase flavoprotein subunit
MESTASSTGVTRRDFVVGSAAVAAGAAVAVNTAHAAEATLTPGTYRGQGKGRSATIIVDVTVDETTITNIEFVETVPAVNEAIASLDDDPYAIYAYAMLDETAQILATVTDRLGQRIVDAQSLNVDAVCGATISSYGYLSAVEDALAQAGADASAFDAPVPTSDEVLTYDDYDLIVVGGGISGITAAAAATEEGGKVLLIEKTARLGGIGSMSTGFRVCGSKLQTDAEANGTLPDENVAGAMTGSNDDCFTYAMEETGHYAKAPLVRQFLEAANQMADFIVEKGGFEFNVSRYGLDYAQDSIIYPMAAECWNRVASTVDTVLTETKATELITDDQGAVVGVKAERYDGAQIEAHAAKVVVATGGFMGNAQMQEEFNHGSFSTAFAMAQNKGEGLQMEWNVGAAKYRAGGVTSHITQPLGRVTGFDDYAAMIPHTLAAAPCFMQVNRAGERFHPEDALLQNMNAGNAYIVSNGGTFYTIVSQEQVDVLKEQGMVGLGMTSPVFSVNFDFYPDPIDYKMEQIEEVLAAGIEAGFIFKGETYEELAEAAGMNPDLLADSAARYEAACDEGADHVLGKAAEYLYPMGSGPYYAVGAQACPYNTIGGISVDYSMRVLREDGQVVENLYAAGCETIGNIMSGGRFSDFGGWSFGWAGYSGYAAGRAAMGNPVQW